MSEVKALFPIGKTQWRKWNDDQRVAFNEAREAGVPFADAVEQANRTEKSEKSKKDFFDILEDAVETVAEVVEVATPVIAVAKTVKRITKRKAK